MAHTDKDGALEGQVLDPGDTKISLQKIKRQLSAGSGSVMLQGSLLKRSDTLRKWNQRWVTLDPTTAKMEYRTERGDLSPRGLIVFEADSTITISPVNFHGARKYDGCCFYVGTPHKKEYFFCAETPVAARSWVATLRAASLVLKAHKEAVSSLSGNGSAKLGTVAAVVAAANETAREAMKDIGTEMKASIKAALSARSLQATDGVMDDLSIMKETMRVKDEELNQLVRELRARDITIKELADRLSETADAAEAAAAAAYAMDKQRKVALEEAARMRKEIDDRTKVANMQLRAADERLAEAYKVRDEALREAQMWQRELAKAREQMLLMEAGLHQSEERARKAAADAAEKGKILESVMASNSSDVSELNGRRVARLSESGPPPLDSRTPNESASVTPEQGHPVASVDAVMVKPEVVINKESHSSLGRNFDKLQDTDNPEVEHAHDLKVVSNQELLLANEREISIDTGMKISEKSVPEQSHGSVEIGREYLERSMPQQLQGPVQGNAEYVERSAPEQGHGSIEVGMEYLEKGVPEQGQGSVTIETSTSFSERDAPQQGHGLDETSAQHKD